MMQRSVILLLAGFLVAPCTAQVRLVGTVKDTADQPLAYASIGLPDLGYVAQSDPQGGFVITGVRPGATRLRVALIGYTSLDSVITLGGTQQVIELHLRQEHRDLRPVEVSALRAGDRSPYATTTVDRERIRAINTGVDMPLLLDQLPSVVTNTDAGTGFGYTGMRIRGSDATRINVTINGVPLNDAESQAVYWVDLPDLATSTEDIEVQRGVGGSTNGPGAFGASVNVRTTALHQDPYVSVSAFGGSYGTQRYTARLGSGLLKDHFAFDGRISSIRSEGYIDRATADLKSYFLQGAWVGRRSSLRFITFSGHEVTYQAWNGVPKEVIDTNRTWNEFTYGNQVDDYTQTHYQLLFEQRLGANTDLNITLFRVDGRGYYEEYRTEESPAGYGIPVPPGPDSVIIDFSTTDLIRRRWLDNSMNGMNLALRHRMGRSELYIGGSAMRYDGQHFGEVLWTALYPLPALPWRYYDNDARKEEANVFAKYTLALTDRLDLFGDAQVRTVRYDYDGFGEQGIAGRQRAELTFFNPKAGLLWKPAVGHRAYASFAVGGKEPGRDDFVSATPSTRPRSETLYDTELGYTRSTGRYVLSLGLYNMAYADQLVSTGKLNDIGLYVRTNIPRSYRQGIELQARAILTERLSVNANATFSRNKARDYADYADDYDQGGQRITRFAETDLAFSPGVIAGGELGYRFWRSTQRGEASLTWVAKFVGRQFLDNTASEERSLDAYVVNDLRANVSLTGVKGTKRIDLNLTVRNVFSELYASNGWSYTYFYGGQRVSGVGYYPQAPINVLAGVTVDL